VDAIVTPEKIPRNAGIECNIVSNMLAGLPAWHHVLRADPLLEYAPFRAGRSLIREILTHSSVRKTRISSLVRGLSSTRPSLSTRGPLFFAVRANRLGTRQECKAYDLPSPPVLGALLAQMKKNSSLHFDDCGLKHHFSFDR
jgi:hypothetical protein